MAPEDPDLDLDLDLDAGAAPALGLPPAERGWNIWLIAGAVALAVAGGAFARWWTAPNRTQAALTAAVGSAAAPDPSVAASPSPASLPPLDQMDPFIRALLGGLSARPELAAWLATDDLVQQMAWTIDRVSRGASPARELRVLAPEGAFTTIHTGRVRRIDESSFGRYDGLATALSEVDPAAVARAYQTLRPRLQEAFQAMGTEMPLDSAVQRALDVLAATPIPPGAIEVIEGTGATWAFADPALEALEPAQKHLLRMGPRNAARIVDTLKRVRAQLAS